MLSVETAAQEKAEQSEEIKITDAQKLFTLSLLWSEAKYNFVYFDQVPDLHWKAACGELIDIWFKIS